METRRLLSSYFAKRFFSWKNLISPSRKLTRIVQPGLVSSSLLVPEHIKYPSYVTNGTYSEITDIEIKTSEEIKGMRKACHLARTVLNHVGSYVKVGVTTDELDKIVHHKCIKLDAYPSPLQYRGFPKSVCTSVNNVCCHGIPDDQPLSDGDLINIDVTVFYNGFHGDTSATFLVGEVDSVGRKLVDVSQQCLLAAIEECNPYEKLHVIGKAVSRVAKENGFNVIQNLCGHGIGSYFHGPPYIIHIDNDTEEEMMIPGMIFTIGKYGTRVGNQELLPDIFDALMCAWPDFDEDILEPALSEGSSQYRILSDGWTAVSLDDSRSAQFEHTILITDTGAEILTADQHL